MNRVQKIGLVLGVVWGLSVYSASERERSVRTNVIPARILAAHVPSVQEAAHVPESVAPEFRVLSLAPEPRWVLHAAPGARVSFVHLSIPVRLTPPPVLARALNSEERVIMNPLITHGVVSEESVRGHVSAPVHRDEESEPEESPCEAQEDPVVADERLFRLLFSEDEAAAQSSVEDPGIIERSRDFFGDDEA